MLFDIHESVGKECASLQPSVSLERALCALADACREGFHAIVANPLTFIQICKLDCFSRDQRVVYETLRDRSSELGILRTEIRTRIELTSQSHSASWSTYRDGNVIVISAPITDFASSVRFAPTALLGENLRDARIYALIAKRYAEVLDLKGIATYAEKLQGGGNTISDSFLEFCKQDARPCVCIVDSDRRIPGGPLGNTARQLQSIRPATSNHLAVYHILNNVRELENMVPLRTLFDAQGNLVRGVNMRALQVLIELEKLSDLHTLFLDLKTSHKVESLLMTNRQPEDTYWRNAFDSLCRSGWKNVSCCASFITPTCTCSGQCACILVENIGVNLLNHFTHYLETEPTDRFFVDVLSDPSRGIHWLELGAHLLAWLCCYILPITSRPRPKERLIENPEIS